MALSRLALKNLQQRLSPSLARHTVANQKTLLRQTTSDYNYEMLRAFNSSTAQASDGKEVSVTERKKSKSPRRQRRNWFWRNNNNRDFSPALYEFFPSGLGNALMQATDNINRLFENLNITPWSLSGQVKEQDECYKLRYEVPGLSKEDVKITVDDRVLMIKGEHKEESEEGSDDEFWSSRSYGYYNTSLVLPDDAKADEIKAELKDGVLNVIIPRTEKPKKDVKEIEIH